MKISIFGLGYVGAVSLACLARDGHEVVGVDSIATKLELIRGGRSPIVEEGMPGTHGRGRRVAAAFSVTNDVREAVHATRFSFICVGTPSSPNGSQDLSAVRRVAEQIGEALQDKDEYHVVVMRSTLAARHDGRRGAGRSSRSTSGKKADVDFGLCFQPEFLREGSSIQDYDNPPFTVIGAEMTSARRRCCASCSGTCRANSSTTSIARRPRCSSTRCNDFHAVKITFANEIGRLCAVGRRRSATRSWTWCARTRSLNISPAYLKPGFAFGGSCLPKDLRALDLRGASSNDVTTPMLGNVMGSNRAHIDHALELVMRLRQAQGRHDRPVVSRPAPTICARARS